MNVSPVEDRHRAAMTELLRSTYAGHAPLGARHRLADADAAEVAVAAACEGATGFVATEHEDVIGYLLAPANGYLGIAHLAARSTVARRALRRLYAVAAAELVDAGVRRHSLPVPVDDAEATRTFFELGFGVDQIDGIVAVDTVPSTDGTDPPVRRATAADLDAVVELATELQAFHRGSPMFQPSDGFDADAIRRGASDALEDDRSVVVVAERGERVVAMAQAGPSSAYLDAFDIGMKVVGEGARSSGLGTAMLGWLLAWAAEGRYRYGTVGWTSANPISDGFYRSRGFEPVRYRLHRRIAATRPRTPT